MVLFDDYFNSELEGKYPGALLNFNFKNMWYFTLASA